MSGVNEEGWQRSSGLWSICRLPPWLVNLLVPVLIFFHLFMELPLHTALPELQEAADTGLKELEQSCCQPWLGRWAGAVVAQGWPCSYTCREMSS